MHEASRMQGIVEKRPVLNDVLKVGAILAFQAVRFERLIDEPD